MKPIPPRRLRLRATRTPRIRPIAAALMLAFSLSGTVGHAAGIDWTQSGDGFWDVGTNWSSAPLPPPAGSDVLVGLGGVRTVTHRSGVTSLASLAMTGGNTLRLSGGVLSVTGTTSVASTLGIEGGAVAFGGATTLGSLVIAAPSPTPVVLGAGAVTVTGTMGWGGGGIGGSGQLTVRGLLTGSPALGTTELSGSRVLRLEGGADWLGGTLTLRDTASITNAAGSTFTVLGSGVRIQSTGSGTGLFNQGTFAHETAGVTEIAGPLLNTGTLRVDAGTLRLVSAQSQITGTLRVASGATLEIAGASVLTGDLGSAAGSTGRILLSSGSVQHLAGTFAHGGLLELAGGSFVGATGTTIAPGSLKVTGGVHQIVSMQTSGTVALEGGALQIGAGSSLGTTTLLNGAQLRLVGTSTASVLQMAGSGATVSGTGQLTVSGASVWAGGLVSESATLRFSGALLMGDALGALRITNTARVQVAGSAEFVQGTLQLDGGGRLDIESGATWSMSAPAITGTGAVGNSGTFAKAGAGVSTVSSAFTSTGTLRVDAGTLKLSGSPLLLAGTLRVAGGSTLELAPGFAQTAAIESAAGSTGRILFSGGQLVHVGGAFAHGGLLELAGGVFNASGASAITLAALQVGGGIHLLRQATVSGNVALTGGSLQLAGTSSLGETVLNGTGQLDVSNTAVLASLQLGSAGARIGGNGTLTVSGTTQWAGGGFDAGIAGSGTQVRLDGFATLAAATGTLRIDDGARVTLAGGGEFLGGELQLAGGGRLVNAAGSAFTLRTSAISGVSGTEFSNAGALVKEGAGSTEISVPFTSTGSLRVDAGTLSLEGSPLLLTGTLRVADGATLELAPGLAQTAAIESAAGSTGRILFSGGQLVHVGGAFAHGGLLELAGGVFNASGASAITLAALQVGGGIHLLRQATVSGNVALTGGSLQLAGTSSLGETVLNGTGQLDVSNTAVLASLRLGSAGARIGGNGTLTVSGTTLWAGGGFDAGSAGSGTQVRLDGFATLAASTGTLRIDDGARVTLAGGGELLAGELQLAGGGRLVNAAGSTFTLRTSAISGVSGTEFSNAGLLVKVRGGSTEISAPFNNSGRVDVREGTLRFMGPVVQSGGPLEPPVWRVGPGATLTFGPASAASPLSVLGLDLTLDGADSQFRSGGGSVFQTLEQSLTTIESIGALRLAGARNFAASAPSIANRGTVDLAGGTFTVGTLVNDAGPGPGVLRGFGTVQTTAALTGDGTVIASGGTLSIPAGLGGTAMQVQVDSGGTLNLAGASADHRAGTLALNGGALLLDARNVVVHGDFVNTAAGTGNFFAPRVNVSGAGAINGHNASQTLVGDVRLLAANSFTMDFGVIRGGTSVTRSFAVRNDGSGAAIRGALQTGAPGSGSLGDPRLSGTGVTAANFGPIAAGDQGPALSVTFNGSSGGLLSSQSVGVASNFANVATDTLRFTGAATALARGEVAGGTSPVTLANFRIGGSAPQLALGVRNLATGTFTERLGIDGVGTSGNFAVQNLLGGALVAPGVAQPSAVRVRVDNGVAGVNAGTLTVQFATDGSLISPGFTWQASNLATVGLNASGFARAVGELRSDPLAFGVVQVGQTVQRDLVIANAATGPAGFVEDLRVARGAVTGAGASRITATGAIAGLAAGSVDASSIRVTVDTSSVGTVDASLGLDFFSTGRVSGQAISGLSEIAAGNASFAVRGAIELQVVDRAQPRVEETKFDLGAYRVGDVSREAVLSIRNVATGNPQAMLDAAVRSAGAPVVATGSVTGLLPGQADDRSLRLAIDTSSAGRFVGAEAQVRLVSDASNVGNCAPDCRVRLEDVALAVDARVYAPAVARVQPGVDFGIRRVGEGVADVVARAVAVENVATATPLDDTLAATIGGASGVFSAGGTVSGLAAGQGNATALQVGMSTARAGLFTGTAVVTTRSQNPEMDDQVGTETVTLVGQVNNLAQAAFRLTGALPPGVRFVEEAKDSFLLDFGDVAQGSSIVTARLAAWNRAPRGAPADTLQGAFEPGTLIGFDLAGFKPFSDVGADGTGGEGEISLDPLLLGSFSDSLVLRAFSFNPDQGGLKLDAVTLKIVANVFDGSTAVIPLPAGGWLLFSGLAVLAGLHRRRAPRRP